MVSTFTTAKRFEKPARGDLVGTWDTPVNANEDLADAILGQSATVSVSAGSVVLAANQYQCCQIILSSTLVGNIEVTFPSTFIGMYIIQNNTTGSSAFTVTLRTTAAAGQRICAMPGEVFDVFNDGTNLKYRNLERVGSYWDYAGSSVPAWVSGCTVPPYLACTGGTFSSATYPALTAILGGTTLPDSQGRFRATLNGGTGRITSGSSTGGVDGNTKFASGGSQVTTLSSQNIPPVPVTDPGHTHTTDAIKATGGVLGPAGGTLGAAATINSAFTGITAGNATPTNFPNLPPVYIGGITMIRAA